MVFTEDLYGNDTSNYYGDGIGSIMKSGYNKAKAFQNTEVGQALTSKGKQMAKDKIQKKDTKGYLAGIL